MPSVIDARFRHRAGSLVPLPAGPWSAQVPALADPERRAFAAEIAAMMDARKDRIGEHAAEHSLPWAVNALGPVSGHPLDRLDWQRRASSISAYRELSGHDHPADPIGPEPVAAAPDMRAAWHEALAALGPADGPDVRGMPEGHCSTCAIPTPSRLPGRRSGSATNARPYSPPSWPTEPTGTPPPAPSGTWP